MRPNCRSSGVATAEAIVSGLAPGKPAPTEMTGNSTWGKGATGRKLKANAPAMSRAAASNEVPTGRLMNGPKYSWLKPHCSVPQQLWRRLFDGIADAVPRESLRQPIEPQVDDRGGVEREHLAHQQAAHDGDAQRMPQLRTGSATERQRQAAEQRRHRRHHDGPEPQQAGLVDGFLGLLAFHALGLQREVEHHDRVLLYDADEQDDADQRHHPQIVLRNL